MHRPVVPLLLPRRLPLDDKTTYAGKSGQDDEKIGLIYWLGRACEAQQKEQDARVSYERAMAQDIQFMDLRDRINRLTAGHK